jgi:4-diphosphocytidyl-2-C-methyl-D-erythritol kinase
MRTGSWLEAEARAKVNLRLRIFPCAADGFHPLETIFCRIDLADRVRLRPKAEPGVSLVVTGSEAVPDGRENLAFRAAALFLAQSGADHGVKIELEKRIPVGSGLGGGSSDAAAVLSLLRASTESPHDSTELLAMAAELGSDVPFFVTDEPLAIGWGRGHRLFPVQPVETLPMLVLVPETRIPTAEAYARWDQWYEDAGVAASAHPFELSVAALASWSGIRSLADNDFEPVIYGWYPPLGDLKQRLDRTEPLVALLSGSGSALFAVYEDEEQRDNVAEELRRELVGVRVVSARGPV